MPDYKMVRLTPEEYEMLQKARRELRRKGYQPLQKYMEDDLDIEEDEDDEDGGDVLRGLALGAVVALGAYAIYKVLTKEKEER